MRPTTITRGCGALALGLVAVTRPAVGQGRSAVLRVTAQVVDVGAAIPVSGSFASGPGVTAARAVTGDLFSVIPPRYAALAVSMKVEGASVGPDGMALQLCRPTVRRVAACRRVPLGASAEGHGAVTAADEAVVIRLLGLAEAVTDTAIVTLTLAYPGN